jgi:hypothetical protein
MAVSPAGAVLPVKCRASPIGTCHTVEFKMQQSLRYYCAVRAARRPRTWQTGSVCQVMAGK